MLCYIICAVMKYQGAKKLLNMFFVKKRKPEVSKCTNTQHYDVMLHDVQGENCQYEI